MDMNFKTCYNTCVLTSVILGGKVETVQKLNRWELNTNVAIVAFVSAISSKTHLPFRK